MTVFINSRKIELVWHNKCWFDRFKLYFVYGLCWVQWIDNYSLDMKSNLYIDNFEYFWISCSNYLNNINSILTLSRMLIWMNSFLFFLPIFLFLFITKTMLFHPCISDKTMCPFSRYMITKTIWMTHKIDVLRVLC